MSTILPFSKINTPRKRLVQQAQLDLAKEFLGINIISNSIALDLPGDDFQHTKTTFQDFYRIKMIEGDKKRYHQNFTIFESTFISRANQGHFDTYELRDLGDANVGTGVLSLVNADLMCMAPTSYPIIENIVKLNNFANRTVFIITQAVGRRKNPREIVLEKYSNILHQKFSILTYWDQEYRDNDKMGMRSTLFLVSLGDPSVHQIDWDKKRKVAEENLRNQLGGKKVSKLTTKRVHSKVSYYVERYFNTNSKGTPTQLKEYVSSFKPEEATLNPKAFDNTVRKALSNLKLAGKLTSSKATGKEVEYATK